MLRQSSICLAAFRSFFNQQTVTARGLRQGYRQWIEKASTNITSYTNCEGMTLSLERIEGRIDSLVQYDRWHAGSDPARHSCIRFCQVMECDNFTLGFKDGTQWGREIILRVERRQVICHEPNLASRLAYNVLMPSCLTPPPMLFSLNKTWWSVSWFQLPNIILKSYQLCAGHDVNASCFNFCLNPCFHLIISASCLSCLPSLQIPKT